MTLLEAFSFPDSCLVDQKIPKKLYYENVFMNISQKKLLKDELESLTFVYNIAPSTINIPQFISDDYHYDNIAVITATLRSPKYASVLSELIHKVPYPVVLIMNHGIQTLLSLAPKRINRADNTKRTIESIINTAWLDTQAYSEHEKLFLESLECSKLPFENLYKLYEAIISRITALQSSEYISSFVISEDAPKQRLRLEQISSLQSRIIELRNRLKKSDQFNEKMQLNIEIKELEKQMELEKQGLLWKN